MKGVEMKTYQIFKNVSYEYFVEAESLEEAQNKIIRYNPQPESEDLIEWIFGDAQESSKMEKFFCLASDSLIHFLGQFETWEDAENHAQKNKIDVIWLFGEMTAKSWKDTITENL